MITRIITNHVKEGHREEYIAASKAFCAALVERNGCLEAHVYADEGSDDVINFEKWPDMATIDAVMSSDTFQEFLPKLIPHFAGNETVVMREV